MALAPDRSILLVEDSPEDREATVRAIKKAGLTNALFWCDDGDKALDYLYQRGEYAGPGKAPRPGVILLDLNMPGSDGREVLVIVRNDPNLKSIPIVVLTTSTDVRDIEAVMALGANSYIVKPVGVDGVVKAVQQLQSIWKLQF